MSIYDFDDELPEDELDQPKKPAQPKKKGKPAKSPRKGKGKAASEPSLFGEED